MTKVTRSGKDFDMHVQIINKRPDEAAQQYLDLCDKYDKLTEVVYDVIESGELSRGSLIQLTKAL